MQISFEKKRSLEEEYSSNKKGKNSLSDNTGSEKTEDQSSNKTTIFDLPHDIIITLFSWLTISDILTLSVVNNAYFKLVDNYFFHLLTPLLPKVGDEPPPNITKNNIRYFFFIKKEIENLCEEMIKTATILSRVEKTYKNREEFIIKRQVQFIMSYGYKGKYKSSYIAKYLLENYGHKIDKKVLFYIAYLFCFGKTPEDAKLFFEYELHKSSKDLLHSAVEVLFEGLLSIDESNEDALLELYNLIRYVLEQCRDCNHLHNNKLEQLDRNIIYFCEEIFDIDENSKQYEVCLKTIALMCINSNRQEELLREHWNSLHHYSISDEDINLINQNRKRIEKYIEDFRAESDSKLTIKK